MKRILTALFATVLMLGITACGYSGNKSTDEMWEFEFLCEIMDRGECRHDRTMNHAYYYGEDGELILFDHMEDISEKLSGSITLEVTGIDTVDGENILRYCVYNGTEELLHNPFEKTEIAVLLEDKWYIVPGIPNTREEESLYNDVEPGQEESAWVGLGNDYTDILPNGNYRLQLELFGEYAVAEFEINIDE